MTARVAHSTDSRPLVAHVVFTFDYGGLENGIVNLVNGLPEHLFRHAIIALSVASKFKERIRRSDVTVHALNKQPGKDPGAYFRLFALLRKLRPAVVHTRNLGTLEAALVARFAGVPARIHGEHGWDVIDPDGGSRKYRAMRKLISPAIHRYVAVSEEIAEWLSARIGVPAARVTRICNGVDTERFRPRESRAIRALLPPDRFPPEAIVVGSVTRFSEIKDPLNLVHAFIAARREPRGRRLRLLMIGDGVLKAEALRLLREHEVDGAAWLPGSRDDIPALMREMDIFALGSKREGISNTVLEAMASGLPVIASATGGNLELLVDDVSGRLVPPGDSAAITRALLGYAEDSMLRVAHGAAARARALQNYSLRRMLTDYEALYRAHSIEMGVAA